MKDIEYKIGKNCATALVGIKPSNIVSFAKSEYINALYIFENLKEKNISYEVIKSTSSRIICIVYREEILIKHLLKRVNYEFLTAHGYPKNFNIDNYLEFLKCRINENVFPHEVGIFLGYPIEDVKGFINNPNKSLFCGYWKVYENCKEKRKLFNEYKKCTDNLCKKIFDGLSLIQII